jgi:hypothetical protein
MVLIGEMPSEVEGESTHKFWYRCGKCRQVVLLDLEVLEKQQAEEGRKIDVKDCTEYLPTKTYQLGEAIFHSDWSDVGKVKAKERTSSGGQAIVVAFEKLGERRLVENLKVEESEIPSIVEQNTSHEISNPPKSEVI